MAVGNARASSAVRGFEAAGAGCAHADVAGHVAGDLLFADDVLQGDLSTEWT
jgi:hypothetical protein